MSYKLPELKKKVKEPEKEEKSSSENGKKEDLKYPLWLKWTLGVTGAIIFLSLFSEFPYDLDAYAMLFMSLVFFILALSKMNESKDQDNHVTDIKKRYDYEKSEMSNRLVVKHELKSAIKKNNDSKLVKFFTDLLQEYRINVIDPMKTNGKIIEGGKKGKTVHIFEKDFFDSIPKTSLEEYEQALKDGELFRSWDTDKDGDELDGLKKLEGDLNTARRETIIYFSIPIILSFMFTGILLVLGIADILDSSIFGSWTISSLMFLGATVISYLILSFKVVSPTEEALKFLLGKYCGTASTGYRIVFKGISYISPFPKTIRYLDVKEDTSHLTGSDAQSVQIDVSIPYWYKDLEKILNGFDENSSRVEKILEGVEVKDNVDSNGQKEKEGGMIGDKVREFVRGYMADIPVPEGTDIQILDEVLKTRDNLSRELQDYLNENFNHLGVHFDRPVITDINPAKEIFDARNQRAVAQIHVKTEEINAKAATHKAKAISEEAKGVAKAGLIKFKANVKAVEHLKKSNHPEEAMSLITSLLLAEKTIAEIAPALAGMNISLYQIPGIDEILKLVSGYANNLPKKG